MLITKKTLHNDLQRWEHLPYNNSSHGFFFFFCYGSTSPAAGSSTCSEVELRSAPRKFSLLSKWKGPGSLSVMVQHHCWEHKALRWIPMGGCEALEGTQPRADKRCQLAAGPAHQLRVHFWLTGHIQRVGSASTQNLSPSERLVSPHIFVFVN